MAKLTPQDFNTIKARIQAGYTRSYQPPNLNEPKIMIKDDSQAIQDVAALLAHVEALREELTLMHNRASDAEDAMMWAKQVLTELAGPEVNTATFQNASTTYRTWHERWFAAYQEDWGE